MLKCIHQKVKAREKVASYISHPKKMMKRLPDLKEFRKSIHVKGEPLS